MKTKYLPVILMCFSLCTLSKGQQRIEHNIKSTKKPWTSLDLPDDDSVFRFAIVGDRTTGDRSGVFEKGIEKLNLLRPDFVMSVGDFINGYIDNEKSLLNQWNTFLATLKPLKMPFFLVAGNHDYAQFYGRHFWRNYRDPKDRKVMRTATHKVWKQFFGTSYYYFTYKNALFLCLNSQEAGQRSWGIGKAQLQWAKQVLDNHKDVRWTFVFMHNPLWVDQKPKKSVKELKFENLNYFNLLEQTLADRNYSVFTGHFHRYTKYTRNGKKYFTLATTGGGSKLRGPKYGEFDHIMWVTMTKDGPIFANLLLNGILDENIVREAKSKRLATEAQFMKTVKFIPDREKSEITIFFKNPFTSPLHYEFSWEEHGWEVTPKKTSGVLKAGKALKLSFSLNCQENLLQLPACKMKFSAADKINSKSLILVKAARQLFPPVMHATQIPESPMIDGKLNDKAWQGAVIINKFATNRHAGNVSAETQALFTYDRNNLYIGVRCYEPNMNKVRALQTTHDGPLWLDDSIEIFLDTNNDRKTYHQLIVNFRGITYDGFLKDKSFELNPSVATSRDKKTWILEVCIPWKNFKDKNLEFGPGRMLGIALVRTRTQNQEIQQLPVMFGGNHQPGMFAQLRLEEGP